MQVLSSPCTPASQNQGSSTPGESNCCSRNGKQMTSMQMHCSVLCLWSSERKTDVSEGLLSYFEGPQIAMYTPIHEQALQGRSTLGQSFESKSLIRNKFGVQEMNTCQDQIETRAFPMYHEYYSLHLWTGREKTGLQHNTFSVCQSFIPVFLRVIQGGETDYLPRILSSQHPWEVDQTDWPKINFRLSRYFSWHVPSSSPTW